MKHELTIEPDAGVYGRLCRLAVQQRRLPVEVAEEAVGVYVEALAPGGDQETVEVTLPVSTVQYWTRRGEPLGRSAGQELAVHILLKTIEAMRDDSKESGR
ncbi:hypothetical protein [Aurantimonas sp. 22II-16-19i]|uniref:hypothetical protein n=1 Tax=Aurantimonas sp. 22II-16-19i TaxID=1317114 RepID=UPI0009F7A30F|nr:hypothetical protein [Aurantimonas sp. 22II-16-19i]ORE90761.1 hypothetical protein ATO4_20856 [Aurantimonas sp. 22II-16-19i]